MNISTGACVVAAAAGAKVAKHGNRSVSSMCGSGDVVEKLGVAVRERNGASPLMLHTCSRGPCAPLTSSD